MNALELANCIDEDILIDYGQVSDMLRQQHAEIESEKLYSSMKHDEVLALQAEVEKLKEKNLRKSMAIRSLNTQLKKALQYETFNR